MLLKWISCKLISSKIMSVLGGFMTIYVARVNRATHEARFKRIGEPMSASLAESVDAKADSLMPIKADADRKQTAR